MSVLRLSCCACVAALGAVGCQSEAQAPPAPAAAPAAAIADGPPASKGGNQVAATASATTYVYSFAGKRDPFRSYLAELHEKQQDKHDNRKREPTEEYDTNQYRLVAIISGGKVASAMVEDPLGRGHVLTLGGRVGKNSGRVTNIDNAGINIVEQFYDGTGQLLEVSSVMRLPVNEESASDAP